MGVFYVALAFPEGGVIIDSRAYLDMAAALRQDGWSGLDRAVLHFTPGYPLFLLLSARVTGSELIGAGFLQLTLTGVVSILLLGIGRMLGEPRVGLAAAVLYAISPNTALWSLTLMSETLFAFLLTASAVLWFVSLRGPNTGWSFVAGVSLGAAAFVRPIGLPLIIAWLAVGMAAVLRRGAGKTRLKWKNALLVGGYVLLLLPWFVRNWATSGRAALADVPIDTFVRFNLAYVVAEAEGLSRDEAAARLDESIDSWGEAYQVALKYPWIFLGQQIAGIRRSVIGVESGVWARQLGYGLDRQGSFDVLSLILAGNPGQAMHRLATLFQDRRTALHAGLAVSALAYTAILYLLAFGGLRSVMRNPGPGRSVYLLAAFCTIYLLVVPGAAGQARFRIPAEPFLALLAGAGLSGLIDVARRKLLRHVPGPEEDGHSAGGPLGVTATASGRRTWNPPTWGRGSAQRPSSRTVPAARQIARLAMYNPPIRS